MRMSKFTKLLLLFVLCLLGLQGNAQDVTIRANNGSMIASRPEGETDYDIFFNCGGFATWQHEQLSMVLTASDETVLTDFDQLDNPANNIFSDGTHIQIAKGLGQHPVCYLSLSLPKGYRFTEYVITFSKAGETTWTYKNEDNQTEEYKLNTTNGSSTFGETNKGFDTYIRSAQVVRGGASQTISRVSDDMSNVLYFKLMNPSDDRVLITLETAKFYFTAEENYTPILPETTIDTYSRSAVDIPFATSKVDYGTIERKSYNGMYRVSYGSNMVRDLMANMTLYEAEAITDENITHFDGITGKGVKYEEGASHTIRTEGDYFRGGRPAAEGQTEPTEQIYYIESPTYVTLSNGEKNPVGYRIVGAKIDYSYGANLAHGPIAIPGQYETEHHSETKQLFYISGSVTTYEWHLWGWSSNGTKTYYLTADAGMSTTESDKALWFMDENGYIRLVSDPTKALKNKSISNVSNRMAVVSVYDKTDKPAQYAINSSGQITLAANSNMYLCLNVTNTSVPLYGSNVTAVNYFQMLSSNQATYKASATSAGTQTVEWDSEVQAYYPNSAFVPGEFTIRLYDKSGKGVVKEQKVTSTTRDGSLEWNDFNNDAVMIGITGVGLFRGHLTMQALDPYLNMMDVVCNDPAVGLRTTQNFTASDFSVNGGRFDFHLPSGCENDNVNITFENLNSKYFDGSYSGGSWDNTSRINFVKSEHYNSFGTTANNLYTDTLEAAQAKKERLKVSTVGTTKFKFNNAKEVGTQNNEVLTEYPFTLEKYAGSPNGGSFETMTFVVKPEDKQLTRYVFTTDETRFNIAPTTAIQHRAYAFYEMEVHVKCTNYQPAVEFVKVYDNTDYDNSAEQGGSIDQNDAFFGVVVTAKDGTEDGYAFAEDILTKINANLDANGVTAPKSSKQILYLDLSQLKGVLQKTNQSGTSGSETSGEGSSGTGTTTPTYSGAVNCLVFMPEGSGSDNNNVAYKIGPNLFHAANDIVLIDKQPFFSPYDIQVGSENYATYTRMITRPENGVVAKGTLILPFAIDITNGVHTNADGKCSFSLNTMDAGQNFTQAPKSVDHPSASFSVISGEKSVANTPYVVKVLTCEEDGDNLSFVVRQKAATIVATPTETSGDREGLGQIFFTNETVNGQYTNKKGVTTAYTCTQQGTFAGVTYDRAVSENVFYFAANQFLNLHTLAKAKGQYLYNYPFRSAYTYPDGGRGESLLRFFDIIFEGDLDDTDAIAEMAQQADLAVKSGKGTLSMSSAIDQTISVRSLNGMTVEELNMRAGDNKTINLPAGIYVVNNVKIVVK